MTEPFTDEEKHAVTFSMCQQVAQLICTCVSNSNLKASDVDHICGFKKGHTLRLLNKCLDWDGKWNGPSLRDIALIAYACNFRIDFEMVPTSSRVTKAETDIGTAEGNLAGNPDPNVVKLG